LQPWDFVLLDSFGNEKHSNNRSRDVRVLRITEYAVVLTEGTRGIGTWLTLDQGVRSGVPIKETKEEEG
jgi:hypothetical protein